MPGNGVRERIGKAMKLDTEKLTRAWEKVREKDAADGMVSRGAQRFGSRYDLSSVISLVPDSRRG